MGKVQTFSASIVNMNEKHMLVNTTGLNLKNAESISIDICFLNLKKKRCRKFKITVDSTPSECLNRNSVHTTSESRYYLLGYQPRTEYSRYLIDKYLLKDSIA
jgi:hypothetical protein